MLIKKSYYIPVESHTNTVKDEIDEPDVEYTSTLLPGIARLCIHYFIHLYCVSRASNCGNKW